MRKTGVGQYEFKIGRWVFLTFIFFLLITTSNEQNARIDETFQYDTDSLIHASHETDRLTYAPWVSHGDGKALSSFGPDPDSSYGNHGPFIVSPDANNRDAASVDDTITIDGNHPSGYDRIGYNSSVLRGGMAFSLNVPKRARIEEAYLWLHAAGAFGTESQVQIYVYNVSSVSAFTETTLSNGLLSHAPLWPTSVSWIPPAEASWDGWVKVAPSSLTQLVQSVVNRTDWQMGNYIGLVIDGGTTGNWWRAWHQYGHLPGYAPKLSIRYTYPDWWDINYQKRVPINVTNIADTTLPEGYSVSFSLNTWYLTNTSELQADGDDLRILFFNSSSSEWKQLDRVNTTAFNAYKTQIWFKTQMSIPANSYDSNYYLYYDNPSAYNPPDTSWGQDLEGAFLFFEDFDDGNMFSRWTAQGSWSDEIYPGGSNNHVAKGAQSAYLYKTTGSYGDVAISARIRWDGGDRRRGVSVRYDASLSYSYRLRMESAENGIELRRQASQSSDLNTTTAFPSGVNYDAGNWYRYEIAAQTVDMDEVFVHGRIYDTNMTLRMELTYLDTSSYSLYADNKIALYGAGWFDDVVLRKFVNPEPTVSLNSPLDTHLMLLTKDSTDPIGTYDGGEGGSVNNVPFYNHIVQELGYVVDYHGHENLASAGDPFFLEGYDGVLISPAVDNAWTVSLREAAIPILTWEERNGDELYLGEASGG
ncbi:MAG: hypothetical protein ACFFCW_30900, partial [Candidatus Hodarchaeota archaeon]